MAPLLIVRGLTLSSSALSPSGIVTGPVPSWDRRPSVDSWAFPFSPLSSLRRTLNTPKHVQEKKKKK
ncbi:hypothetical protein LX32DRAFT_638313 [Colletotrichum zoysiae]|uniref:Secreted protein n=1 Tax=Colletotrichum zoysiae TaxID=1216348 RepID=A0AAD9HLG2_9PEZI|nr:hypothetical protein LX32DRAFT_638313 [Colletotrichum zoysiae]